MNRPLAPVLFALALSACDKAPPPAQKTPEELALGENVFKQVCHACHGMGVAGAPKLGEADQWKTRVKQGVEPLYKHALEGFKGTHGTMPARGGKPDLSDEQVKAGVDYMLSKLPPI